MAEINNAVALGVQTPPQQDIIGPITSLAQLQYLQAHGALEGAQAGYYQGRNQAYQTFGTLRGQGMSIPDALTKSNLPAYDAAGASSLVTLPNTERINAASAAFGANPTPENAAGISPEAYAAAQTGRQTQVKTLTDIATAKGQLASELLGGIVTAPDGSQTLPPQVRSDLIQRFKSLRAATGQPLDPATEQFLWSAPVAQLKPLALGMQQGGIPGTETPTVAGAKEGAVTAAKEANTPHVLDVTQGLAPPPPSSALPGYSAGAGAGAPPPSAGLAQMQMAFLGQESRNKSDVPTSVNGAQGPGQILPSTFKAYAQPGENINNANDNRNVSGRIIADYYQRYNGDPGRVATAYFSGPGNVAPPGSPTPWKNNFKDGNGKYVSEYVHDMVGRLGSGGPSGYGAAVNPAGNGTAMPSPAAGGPPQPAPTPLQAAGALPLAASAFAPQQPQQPGHNPLAPAPPVQNTVAPIPGAVPPLPGPAAARAPAPAPGTPQPSATVPGGPVAQPTAPPDANGRQWLVPPQMTIAEKAAQEETGKGMAAAQVKQFTDAKQAYQNASMAQMRLGELRGSLDSLPQNGGLLTPGSGAPERLGLAKYVNTVLQAVGEKPMFDPNAVAAAENSQKITGTLGFDMSRSLGSKEAASITEQAIKLNPGIENSPMGARTVSAALNAGFQRDKDFYQFLSQHGNSPDADLKFNKEHPPSQYVNESQVLARAHSSDIALLQAHANDPRAAAAFDAKYGRGMSRYFTGQ